MSMTPLRRRATVLTVGMLSAALLLTGCGNSDEAATNTDSETHTVEADNGTIEVPAHPLRVAALKAASLSYLDLGGDPIAVTTLADTTVQALSEDQQDKFAAAENVGETEVDMEKLASLKPDLILITYPESKWDQVEAQFEAIAPTVYYGLGTDWKVMADGFAEASGLTDSLNEQKSELKDKIAQIQDTYGGIIANDSFVAASRDAYSDPGTFYISDIGCVEVLINDVGMNYAKATDGEDPLAHTPLPFEQIAGLSQYDVISYPVDAEGQPTEAFEPVVATNTWQALPQVQDGQAIGLHCAIDNSYGGVLQYLDSVDKALATLSAAKE